MTRIGVVGCGLMGAGIVEVCARAGLAVTVVESSGAASNAGRSRIERSLQRASERGKLDADPLAVIERIAFSTNLDDLADRVLVIEAIVEDEQTKVALFAQLDEIVVSDDAILASNTSSIPISRLAAATSRPQQVIGIHFFNPVPVLTLVELIPGLLTSPETTTRAREFVTDTLEKYPVESPDRAGFIVNALLIPFLLNAIRMLEAGLATAEDIDEALVRGAAHPQGPLRLADLVGLDTCKAVADSLYAEFKEPVYASPPLLNRMVEAGLLGRKSGRGFYTYDE